MTPGKVLLGVGLTAAAIGTAVFVGPPLIRSLTGGSLLGGQDEGVLDAKARNIDSKADARNVRTENAKERGDRRDRRFDTRQTRREDKQDRKQDRKDDRQDRRDDRKGRQNKSGSSRFG